MSSMRNKACLLNTCGALFLGLLATSVSTIAHARNPFEEYVVMAYERPAFPNGAPVEVFSSGLKPLWTKALQRKGDTELQRMAIDTIAIAHHKGMQGLEDLQKEFVAILEDPDSNADVVRAAANALIEFEAKDKSELLAKVAIQRQATIAQLIEPALAKWKSPAMEEHWITLITQQTASNSSLLLAIEGLGLLSSKSAIKPLNEIVKDSRVNSRLRMAASRSLGSIDQSELVELAQTLAEQPSEPEPLGALLAIELLRRHKDEKAVLLLEKLLSRPSTAVQANALESLFEIDIKIVDRHVDKLILSSDVNVRRTCIKAMIARSDADRFSLLAKSLDDVNPTLRREVATGLVALSEKVEHREPVIESTIAVLNENSWRGCEQATVVLTKLDHKPAGRRLVELLSHERPEVKVASAWALSRLQIEELLPDMLEHAESIDKGELVKEQNGLSDQISHLFTAFGDQKYQEANSIMRTFVPKADSFGRHSRPAAVWALGVILEGKLDDSLAKDLVARLNDVEGMIPEDDAVRCMSALSLGRMNAKSALSDLKKHSGVYSAAARACAWAIEKMTGEKAPPVPPPGQTEVEGWFLKPIPAS